MALPCLLHAVFMMRYVYKGHLHQLYDSPRLQLLYKQKGIPKTCLTNYKGSISHHIMPLVINIFGGGETHTHTQAYR